MLSPFDQKIVLDVIRTGDFTKLDGLRINLDQIYSPTKITRLYKGSDQLKCNFKLAEKITNPLIIENNNMKKRITQLVASELNYYMDDKRKKDHIYSQLNSYISKLISFPEKKRVVKFLVKFALTSKALQSLLRDNSENYEILYVYKKINSEVKR